MSENYQIHSISMTRFHRKTNFRKCSQTFSGAQKSSENWRGEILFPTAFDDNLQEKVFLSIGPQFQLLPVSQDFPDLHEK